jgi:hypothetical protein
MIKGLKVLKGILEIKDENPCIYGEMRNAYKI